MDINILKRKRQKNVQEQNELKKHYMHEHAVGFSDSLDKYTWLQKVLVENGIAVNKGILVSLNSCIEQGSAEECDAIWVTSNKQFYEIGVVLNYGTHEIEEIEGFSKVAEIRRSQCSLTRAW